jgi:hypothetical protein
VGGVVVAMGAELLEFEPCGRVTTVFHRRIAGNTGRALIRIGPALGAFQRNYDSYAFTLCHDLELRLLDCEPQVRCHPA